MKPSLGSGPPPAIPPSSHLSFTARLLENSCLFQLYIFPHLSFIFISLKLKLLLSSLHRNSTTQASKAFLVVKLNGHSPGLLLLDYSVILHDSSPLVRFSSLGFCDTLVFLLIPWTFLSQYVSFQSTAFSMIVFQEFLNLKYLSSLTGSTPSLCLYPAYSLMDLHVST